MTAQAERIYIEPEYIALAEKYETEDISSELILSVIWTESRGKPNATNSYNHGLMQLHEWYFTGDLYEPENNIMQGAAYLQELYERYKHIPTVLMVYHGEGNAVGKGQSGNYSYYATNIIEQAEFIEENRKCTANCGSVTEELENASTQKPERYSTLKK